MSDGRDMEGQAGRQVSEIGDAPRWGMGFVGKGVLAGWQNGTLANPGLLMRWGCARAAIFNG